MNNDLEEKVKAFMLSLIRYNEEDYLNCGEVNCTKLAEDTAEDFKHEEWCDDPNNEIWAWASDIAKEIAEENK